MPTLNESKNTVGLVERATEPTVLFPDKNKLATDLKRWLLLIHPDHFAGEPDWITRANEACLKVSDFYNRLTKNINTSVAIVA